jgi:hypothetical protein
MYAKALLIPIAALALSATGVSAYNSDVLERAGLSEEQISAFETARELRKEGDRDGARGVLESAGVDLRTIESVREAMSKHKNEMKSAIETAVDNDDYDAFLKAIEGSPLADIINTKDDFEQFAEAYKLKEQGEFASAKEIMDELGFEQKGYGHPFGGSQQHKFGGKKN